MNSAFPLANSYGQTHTLKEFALRYPNIFSALVASAVSMCVYNITKLMLSPVAIIGVILMGLILAIIKITLKINGYGHYNLN